MAISRRHRPSSPCLLLKGRQIEECTYSGKNSIVVLAHYFSRISLSHLIPYHKHFVIWTQPQTEYSKQVQEQLLKTESPTYAAHLSLLHF